MPLSVPGSFASESTLAAWDTFNATVLPWASLLRGFAIAWYALKRFTDSPTMIAKAILPHAVLLIVTTAWVAVEVL